MFVKGVANATPFFFVIVFRVIVQTDLVCLVCEGSCKCKKQETLLFRAGSLWVDWHGSQFPCQSYVYLIIKKPALPRPGFWSNWA